MENDPPITPPQTGPEPPVADSSTPTPSVPTETTPPAASADEPTLSTPTEPVPPLTDSGAPTTNVFSPEPQPTAPITPEKKPNNLLKILIPIIAVLVVGIVLFFVLKPKDSPTPTPTTPDNPSDSPETPDNPQTPDTDEGEISDTWFDNSTVPGATYGVKINRKTGEFSLKDTSSCSTEECLNGDEWPDAVEKSGTFSAADLEKILKVYDNLDTEEEHMLSLYKTYWFIAISSIAEGDEAALACSAAIDTEDIAMCNQMDLDSDGIITRRELGLGSLDELITEINQE